MGIPLWILYSLLAMLSAGFGNFLIKLSGHWGQSMSQVMLIVFLIHGLAALLILAFLKPGLQVSGPGFPATLGAGICLVLVVVFLNLAFLQPESKTAVVVAILNTSFALVTGLSFILLKECLSLKQLAGMAAVLTGIFLLI